MKYRIKIEKKITDTTPRLWMTKPSFYQEVNQAFSILKNKIIRLKDKEKKSTFLLTGIERKTGTSTIAFNLSITCSRDLPEFRIVLIDTNLSHPSLHNAFKILPEPGIVDFLNGMVSLEDTIQKSFLPNLDLITIGTTYDSLPAPFTPPSFQYFLELITKQYDLVFIDSAPGLMSGHTQSISTQVDGVIMVAEAHRTRLQAVSALTTQLDQDDARLVGSFLNRRRHIIPRWLYEII